MNITTMTAPWVRHDPISDIFGPSIELETLDGFFIIFANEIKNAEIQKSNRFLKLVFKDGNITRFTKISEFDFNEILCWLSVNKVKFLENE
ncbi:hypothetical protein [Bacillus marasmi]|uniref:hypothetical protein n=1 Tax=Bacillus marasmi TaxID=1926279 RepID=UPI0011C93705|nr:hypothetical protein [Bacillus marasmi]